MPKLAEQAPPTELTFDYSERDEFIVARGVEEPDLIAVEKSVDELEAFLPRAVKSFLRRHDRGEVEARVRTRTAFQFVVAITPLAR